VAEQRQDDDQSIEELHVESGQTNSDDTRLDERNGERSDCAANHGADPPQGGVPPTNTDAMTGSR
jgi:hypothetical protein